MKYLSTHENLKLPWLYRQFPDFFSKAIQIEVAKVAHLIVPPNARINGGPIKMQLAKPQPRPFVANITRGYELSIYTSYGLLNYCLQSFALNTNPRIYLNSKADNLPELVTEFDGNAKMFAELVGTKHIENGTFDAVKALLLKQIKNNRVFQLGHYGISVIYNEWNSYQITKIN